MRGQLRLPLCDAAKYRNSRKGLFMQASINRRLVTWWQRCEFADVDKFHPSIWAMFFYKSPVMLLCLILFAFRSMRTDRRKGWMPFSWISRGHTLLAPCDKPNPLNSQKCASAPWPIGCAQKSVLRHRRARTDSKFIWAGSKMISISFRWASMLLSRLGAFWTANLAFVTWMRRGLRLTRSICATRSAAFRRWFLDIFGRDMWAVWAIWPVEHTCLPARSSFFLRGGQPGWFDFRMDLSVFSSLCVEKMPKFCCAIKPDRKLHICSEDHGIAALSGKVAFAKMLRPSFSIQLYLAKCGYCACLSATLPSTALLEKVCSCRHVSIGA